MTRFAAPLAGLVAAAALAAEPGGQPPILKPAAPPAGAVRVRVPLHHGDDAKILQLKAVAPKNGKKPAESAEVTVGMLSGGGPGMVTTGTLRAWGYETPANRLFVLPELLVPGEQTGPKPAAGKETVRARFANVKLQVVDSPPDGKSNQIFGTDLLVTFGELVRTNAAEPRVYFTDKLFDLNVAAANLKRPDGPPAKPEPKEEPDPRPDPGPLTAFAAPIQVKPNGPMLAGVSVNGVETVKNMRGGSEPVPAMLSLGHYTKPGLVLTRGMAYAVGLEAEANKEGKAGTATDRKVEYVAATVKELKFTVAVGAGFKTPKEVVLTDVPVVIDKGVSEATVYVGPEFLNAYFPDAVFATAADGTAKLYGRTKADTLKDPKPKK